MKWLLNVARRFNLFPGVQLPTDYAESLAGRWRRTQPLDGILPPELAPPGLDFTADLDLDELTLAPGGRKRARGDSHEEDTLEPPQKRRRDALRALFGTLTGSNAGDNALVAGFAATLTNSPSY